MIGWWRFWAIACVAIVSTLIAFGQSPSSAAKTGLKYKLPPSSEMDKALVTLAEESKRVRLDNTSFSGPGKNKKKLSEWEKSLKLEKPFPQLASGELLSEAERYRSQRVINDLFKPVPIANRKLNPVLDQPRSALVPVLTKAVTDDLERMARSVGRVMERQCDGSPDCLFHLGTLFNVGEQLAATNCHVIAKFAEQGDDGRWRLKPSSRLETSFNDGPLNTITLAENFEITHLAGCSSVEGLDVAFLTLSPVSIDRQLKLPPPLPIERKKLVRVWSSSEARIHIIGFPKRNSRHKFFRDIEREFAYGKVASPGILVAPTITAGEFLVHEAPTEEGNSGSPVIDMQSFPLTVIGVHSCCQEKILQAFKDPLPCATVFEHQGANLAIPTWRLTSDSIMGPLFERGLGLRARRLIQDFSVSLP